MDTSPAIDRLVVSLKRLPGIGEKSATRLAFFLLGAPKEWVQELAEAVHRLQKDTVLCESCFNLTDRSPCTTCRDETRSMHPDDVGMVQPGGQLDLAGESGHELRLGAGLLMKDLDGQETLALGLARLKHRAHASLAQERHSLQVIIDGEGVEGGGPIPLPPGIGDGWRIISGFAIPGIWHDLKGGGVLTIS